MLLHAQKRNAAPAGTGNGEQVRADVLGGHFYRKRPADTSGNCSPVVELRSIAYAIERLGCRMGEDPEQAILRKEALADRVRAVAAQIGGTA